MEESRQVRGHVTSGEVYLKMSILRMPYRSRVYKVEMIQEAVKSGPEEGVTRS